MNIFEKGLLSYLTKAQLKKIQSTKIGIGGAGGLGSNIAMILVRSGFKNLEIIDEDVIEASNLNRQQYFINEIGQCKVETLKNTLLKINPDLNVLTHHKSWKKDESDQYFKGCTYLVEAFDQVQNKHSFVDTYHTNFSALVSGNGMAGLTEGETINTKQLGNIYFVGDRKTDVCDGHPPMAPRVITCAAIMTEIILKLTLSSKNSFL